MKKKLVKTILLLSLSIFLFAFPTKKIPLIDRHAEAYFSDAMQKAGLAYATVRVINASVSVIKDSEVQLEPGGVGLSLAAGQIVDPIDDLSERLSDVLITAIASLGVQRLLFEIGISLAPPLLACLMAILAGLIWLDRWGIDRLCKLLVAINIIVITARFFLPLSSLLNDFLYKNFFLDDIKQTRQNLALATVELEKLKEIHLPEMNGIAETLKNSTAFLKMKTIQFKDALVAITHDMGDIVVNLLKLTWLYIGIMLLQVIVLPLAMFWLLFKLLNTLFSLHYPLSFVRTDMMKAGTV